MGKVNPWKIGIGTGAVILGLYFLFGQFDSVSKIFGIIVIAFGIGLIASN